MQRKNWERKTDKQLIKNEKWQKNKIKENW